MIPFRARARGAWQCLRGRPVIFGLVEATVHFTDEAYKATTSGRRPLQVIGCVRVDLYAPVGVPIYEDGDFLGLVPEGNDPLGTRSARAPSKGFFRK